MRYPTRASELDHRRLRASSPPLHDRSISCPPHRDVRRRQVAPAVLDLGHQSVVTQTKGTRWHLRYGPRRARLLSLHAFPETEAPTVRVGAEVIRDLHPPCLEH